MGMPLLCSSYTSFILSHLGIWPSALQLLEYRYTSQGKKKYLHNNLEKHYVPRTM